MNSSPLGKQSYKLTPATLAAIQSDLTERQRLLRDFNTKAIAYRHGISKSLLYQIQAGITPRKGAA